MSSLRHIVLGAFRYWWQEVVVLLVLNAVWFVLQIPVVTGPPATAVVFAMARRSIDGEYWNVRDAWHAFRQLFWPAWRWALLNLLVWLPGIWNLYAYWHAPGTMWFSLRLLWIATLTIWLAINLLYWPFWLAQQDRAMFNTIRNCVRFLLLHPGLSLALVAFCVLLTALSLITTLPFTLATICWLALMANIAVQQSLQEQWARRITPGPPAQQDERYEAGNRPGEKPGPLP